MSRLSWLPRVSSMDDLHHLVACYIWGYIWDPILRAPTPILDLLNQKLWGWVPDTCILNTPQILLCTHVGKLRHGGSCHSPPLVDNLQVLESRHSRHKLRSRNLKNPDTKIAPPKPEFPPLDHHSLKIAVSGLHPFVQRPMGGSHTWSATQKSE